MYGILIANTALLAATHLRCAPMLLAVIIPSVACFACAARIAIWLRRSRAAVSEDEALRRPGGIVRLAAVLGLVFTGWSLSPYPYGNAYAQFHFAF